MVSSRDTRHVELPWLTQDEVITQSNALLTAQGEFDLPSTFGKARIDTQLTETLAWLWRRIVRPILDEIPLRQPDGTCSKPPRVWWCPTGPLAALPLHAAAEPGAPGALDRVVSSYAPTLRALMIRAAGRKVAPRLLHVALTETPGHLALPAVARERASLHALLGDTVTDMADRKATRRAVVRGLEQHRWAHFSCHGTQDLEDPSRGALILYDGELSIGELARLRPGKGAFAFLAACKTAVGGVAVASEARTMVSAFQYSGFHHVIGALWSIDDEVAASLTPGVYARLQRHRTLDVSEAARALRAAVLDLRASAPNEPSKWALFVHCGH